MKKKSDDDQSLVHPYCGDCGKPFTSLRPVTPREAKAYAEANQCVSCATGLPGHGSVFSRRLNIERLLERAKEMCDMMEIARLQKMQRNLQKQCAHQDIRQGACYDCGATQLQE